MMKQHTLALIFLFVICPLLLSARFRSVEIQVEQIGPLTVAGYIIVITPPGVSMTDSFRETLRLDWGDGTSTWVPITNGIDADGDGVLDGEVIESTSLKFIYAGEHTYTQAGRYLLSMENPNRLGGILNLNFPNSVSIPLVTETEFEVFANSSNNHTPVLLEPGGVDFGEIGDPFFHLPNAYDQDDDSLVYELVTPLMDPGEPAPNYIELGSIDSDKGIFTYTNTNWGEGDFSIAVQITSYRDGVLQDRMIRDIMLSYKDEDSTANIAPNIDLDTPLEIIQEVNIGDTVRFQCLVSDDPDQTIRLTATSGLFSYFDNPATFTIEDNTGTFEWIVRDEHARSQPYPVVIKAEDDFDELGASSFALVRYRVNGGLVNTNEPTVGSWLVYPNPVANELLIQAPAFDVELPLRYQLFNASGQLMRRSIIKSLPGSIEVAGLPTGTYYLQLTTNNQRWTERFVKQ